MAIDILSFKDAAIAVTALIGAGLGLFNFFKERSTEKVKLRVTPRAIMNYGRDENGKEAVLISNDRVDPSKLSQYMAIEVVNLSSFSVVLDSAGFLLKGTRQRMGIYDPASRTGKSWPLKLEPRESVTLHARLTDILESEHLSSIKSAYVETTCGHVAEGTTEALRKLIRLRSGQKPRY